MLAGTWNLEVTRGRGDSGDTGGQRGQGGQGAKGTRARTTKRKKGRRDNFCTTRAAVKKNGGETVCLAYNTQ